MFTYYSISALINFLFSLFASVFLITLDRKNIKEKAVFAFLRYAFLVIFWSAFYFLSLLSNDHDKSLFFVKVLNFFAAFIPISYIDYAITLLGYDTRRNKLFVIFGYFLFLFLILKGIVLDVVPKMSFNFWPVGTNIFPIYLFFWCFVTFISILFLINVFIKNKKNEEKRNHVLLLLSALMIGSFGGITNYFLWFDIPIKPFGNILVSVYFFITLYTVRKYHTKNISLFYIELASLVITMFAFGKIFVSATSFDFYTNILFFIVSSIASVYIIRTSMEQEKDKVTLKNAVKKTEVLNARLVELDKHKDDFVSIAAHQLRTPAGVIRNYVGMMKQGLYGEFPEKLNDPVGRIYENSVLLAETVSSILDISRIESGKTKIAFKKNNVEELLKTIVSELEDNANKKGLKLNLEIKEGINYEIVFDHEKLDHMLANLIDNAIKYTPTGSVTVKLYGNEFFVLVDVADTGRGMSKNFIENQLYQKFAREESVGTNISGNGLGMYFVKEVVELHKGKISVVSELGKGSTFTVAIPTKLKEEEAEVKV